MKTWQKWVTVGGGVALTAGLSTGIALASIPDSGGVIHACYKTPVPAHGTPLSVIDSGAGGSCPNGYVALTWNQAGPQGPAGPPGASTVGPGGLEVMYVRATNGPPPVSSGTVTAYCPADHPFVLGGGGYGASGQSAIRWSGPISGAAQPATGAETATGENGWYVSLVDQSVVAYAWAICAK